MFSRPQGAAGTFRVVSRHLPCGMAVSMLAVVALSAVASAAGRCERSVCFVGAVNNVQVKPRTLYLSADGTLEVVHVTWSRWGGTVARGRGTAYYHGCSPTCAQAPRAHATVTVRLSDTLACAPTRDTPNGLYYNRVRLTLRSGRDLDGAALRRLQWAPCRYS